MNFSFLWILILSLCISTVFIEIAPFVDSGNSINATNVLHFVFQHERSQIDTLYARYDRRLVDAHRRPTMAFC